MSHKIQNVQIDYHSVFTLPIRLTTLEILYIIIISLPPFNLILKSDNSL